MNVTVNWAAWCDECRTVHPLHLPVLLRDTPEDRERLATALWQRAGSPPEMWDANMEHYRADADAIIAALRGER